MSSFQQAPLDFTAQPPKRRSHNTHVCHFCKRRKVRCDKGTPCSACVKYGNPICEYPPEAFAKPSDRADKRPEFGELVLNLDGPSRPAPVKKRSSSKKKENHASPSSSISSTASNPSTAGSYTNNEEPFGTNMHSELEYLKSKISMLEHSISGSSQQPSTGNQMALQGSSQQNFGNQIALQGIPLQQQGLGNQIVFQGIPSQQPQGHTFSAPNVSPATLPPLTSYAPAKPQKRSNSGSSLAPVTPLATAMPVWKNPSRQTPEDMSFMLANNPFLSDSQYFSFHNSYSPFVTMGATSARHHYPLNWVSLIKIYSSISPLFAMKQKKFAKARQILMSSDAEPTEPSDRVFSKKLKEFVGENGAYRADTPVADEVKSEKLKKINLRARAVGLTVYEGDLSNVHDLMEKIRLLLPSRRVIWLLIDRFFERVYPFFPFLDQPDFEEQISQILESSKRDHSKVKKLNVQKKFEIIYLGLLLLVLRLSYLTLFTNNDARNEANLSSSDPSPKAQQLKFLLNNPIDTDAFGVAQLCLSQLGYLRYTNLPILQLCLYLKIYNSFAPENGEGADDSNSQGFCSRIIDMAMSLGLHREPDNFRTKVRDDKTNNLCRKIWWYLVLVDIIGGLTNGSPLTIKRSQFDVLPPFHRPGNENIRDTALEAQIIFSIARFDSCYDRLYEVVSVISDVRAPLRMGEFCAKLSEMEKQFPEVLAEITETINSSKGSVPHIEIANAHWLKIGFQSAFFMVSVNLHFYNHYEKMGETDLAYFYLKKILSVSVYNMMPFYEKFVSNSGDIFKNTTDIAITPSFQTLVHKCTIIIHCVLMRARFSIIKCDSSSSHQRDLIDNPAYRRRYELLKETFILCETCLEIFLRPMKSMTSRYYYCWRYTKAQEKLKSIRNGTEYYLNWCKGKESYMQFNDEMLEDLNGLLRVSIETAEKNKEAELVPDLSNAHASDGSGRTGTASPSDEFANVELNDQFTDELWAQMLTMKPTMVNPGNYGDVSQANLPMEFTNADTVLDSNFLPDFTGAGAGFYDNLLNDLLTQDVQF